MSVARHFVKLSEILKCRSNEIEAVASGVSEEALGELRAAGVSYQPTPEVARVRLQSDSEIPQLIETAHRAGGRLVSVSPLRESLEDLFVRAVGVSSRQPEHKSYNRN